MFLYTFVFDFWVFCGAVFVQYNMLTNSRRAFGGDIDEYPAAMAMLGFRFPLDILVTAIIHCKVYK